MIHALCSSECVQPLLTMTAAAVAVMGSPGPATISVAATGSAFGFGKSLSYLIGIISGTTAVLLLVAASLLSVFASRPHLVSLLHGISAVYMVYLAFRIAAAPAITDGNRYASPPGLTSGFALAVANPKAYAAIAAVYGGAVIPAHGPVAAAGIKIAVLMLMIVSIHCIWLVTGTCLARFLHRPAMSRAVNILFAAVLLVTAVKGIF